MHRWIMWRKHQSPGCGRSHVKRHPAVQERQARATAIAITVATIPGIVIFAYALGLFAGIVMSTVTHLKIKFGLARARPAVSRRARVWARALRRCDANGDGELTLDELVRGADDICRLVGIDVGARGGTRRQKQGGKNNLTRGRGIDDEDDSAEEEASASASDDDKTSSPLIPVLLVVLMAYQIASLFMGVVELSIDTILLSYCLDSEENGGRPTNAPPLLQDYIGTANQELDK